MRKCLLFLLLLIPFQSELFAQQLIVPQADVSDTTVKHITLDDAILSGFQHNPQIAAAESGVEYSIHMKKAAWGYRLPQINLVGAYVGLSENIFDLNFNEEKNAAVNTAAGFLQSLGIPVPPELVAQLLGYDASFVLQKKNFAFANAYAVYPIFAGGKINALNRAAKINVGKSENELLIAKSDLFSEITERYLGLSLSKSVESLHSDVVAGITSHYNDAVSLENNGMISKTERLYAEMSLSKARAAYVEARNNTSTVNSALAGSISEAGNYDPVTDLFITDSIPSLSWFKESVAEKALLLQKVKFLKELAGENVKGKRADFYPTLSAMGTAMFWNYQVTSYAPKAMYGATASFRIFDGLKTEHEYMASKSQLRQVELAEQKAEQDIQILTEKLYYEMMGAREQVYAMESTIKFAEEYYRAKCAAFREGMATSNDVVDAELNLSKSKIERMSSAYKFDVALSKLLAMTGNWSEYFNYQLSGTAIK